MKKKSINSLSLKKVIISNLTREQIKGMGSRICPTNAGGDCPTGQGSTKCCEN